MRKLAPALWICIKIGSKSDRLLSKRVLAQDIPLLQNYYLLEMIKVLFSVDVCSLWSVRLRFFISFYVIYSVVHSTSATSVVEE